MIINILYIILFSLLSFFPTKHVLHIFQQNRYDYKRYYLWLKSNIKIFNKKYILLFLVLYIFMFLFGKYDFILIVLFSLFSIFYFSIIENKKEYIKPLVLTARVKRQLVVLYILDLIVYILVLFYLGKSYIKYLIIFSLFFNWLLIYISDIVLIPVESLVKSYYLNDAKKILNSYNDLIKIGITGSFGKTSTKNIVQAIISKNYRSLMTPASYNTPMGITRVIREMLSPIYQVFVCEMGADHVGDIKYLSDFVKPKIGIVTSIGPQHLATFNTQDNITNEKMSLIEKLDVDGIGILNYDNEFIKNYKLKNKCKIITYGIHSDNVDYKAHDIKYTNKGSKFKVSYKNKDYSFETKLLGEHNISNILSGIVVSVELGVDFKSIIKAVKNIPYVEHRLEIKYINNIRFIDNAFNSNPVGAKMSLDVLKMMPHKRYIVTPGLIDLGKIQDESNYEFGKYMNGCVDFVVLVGENQTLFIKKGLIDSGFNMDNVKVFKTVKEAFSFIYSNASSKDTVLLENDLPDAFNV